VSAPLTALVIVGAMTVGLLSIIVAWWRRGRRPHRGRHPFDTWD